MKFISSVNDYLATKKMYTFTLKAFEDRILNVAAMIALFYYKTAMMAQDRSPESFPHKINSTFFVAIVPTCDPWRGACFEPEAIV